MDPPAPRLGILPFGLALLSVLLVDQPEPFQNCWQRVPVYGNTPYGEIRVAGLATFITEIQKLIALRRLGQMNGRGLRLNLPPKIHLLAIGSEWALFRFGKKMRLSPTIQLQPLISFIFFT